MNIKNINLYEIAKILRDENLYEQNKHKFKELSLVEILKLVFEANSIGETVDELIVKNLLLKYFKIEKCTIVNNTLHLTLKNYMDSEDMKKYMCISISLKSRRIIVKNINSLSSSMRLLNKVEILKKYYFQPSFLSMIKVFRAFNLTRNEKINMFKGVISQSFSNDLFLECTTELSLKKELINEQKQRVVSCLKENISNFRELYYNGFDMYGVGFEYIFLKEEFPNDLSLFNMF